MFALITTQNTINCLFSIKIKTQFSQFIKKTHKENHKKEDEKFPR